MNQKTTEIVAYLKHQIEISKRLSQTPEMKKHIENMKSWIDFLSLEINENSLIEDAMEYADRLEAKFSSTGEFKLTYPAKLFRQLATALNEKVNSDYDKTAMNSFVQDEWDRRWQAGKHGHYETLFGVVHAAIRKIANKQEENNK